MTAAVAEVQLDREVVVTDFLPEPVLVVPEMAEDLWSRKQAEKIIRFAGSLAVGERSRTPETENADSAYATLIEAIYAASHGEKEARQSVEMNVLTDVVERTIKAGHVMKVAYSASESGKIKQYGQEMDDVYINSLRYASAMPQMRRRAEAETRNGSRIENYYRSGKLEDYNFVVISRCADDMTEKEMEKACFFTDTMSCAIQVTGAEDGQLMTESAFVAGVKEPTADRHDEQTVASLGASLGADFSGMTAAEIIDTPLLVPKNLMPNGAIDLVERYDDIAGGTFFGEAKPRQDYAAYLDVCKQREAKLEPVVQRITDQLVAGAEELRTPIEATKKLHTLSQKAMVDQAIHDNTIDARVFGGESAAHIDTARYCYDRGDAVGVEQARSRAQSMAKSFSCPSGGSSDTDPEGLLGTRSLLEELQAFNGEKDKYGPLKFKCQKGHPNKRPRERKIPRCTTCGINVAC